MDAGPGAGVVGEAPAGAAVGMDDRGEKLMDRSRRFWPQAGLLLTIGVVGLSRFSQNVRSVDVVGLSGSGFAFGVGFALLVLGLTGRIKS